MAPPRGIRNNNPGNIDRSKIVWRGAAAVQADPRFVTFVSMDYGIRALAKTLLAYHVAHGIDTIREIVGRWAPPIENMTGAYVRDVATRSGIGADVPLTFDAPTLVKLCRAICEHENGASVADAYITPAQYVAGVNLAL